MNSQQLMYFEKILSTVSSKLCSHDGQFVETNKRVIETDQRINKVEFNLNKGLDRLSVIEKDIADIIHWLKAFEAKKFSN